MSEEEMRMDEVPVSKNTKYKIPIFKSFNVKRESLRDETVLKEKRDKLIGQEDFKYRISFRVSVD